MTKLSSRLPKGNADGLQRLSGALVQHPHRPRFAIIAFDCQRVTTDMDTGEEEPTARILRIEPINLTDYGDAHQLMRRGYDQRVGQDPLPFGEEPRNDSLDTLFKAARDTSGRVHLKLDDDGNVKAVTVDGVELEIQAAEDALDEADLTDRDDLLSDAMDAVIQAQDASPATIIELLITHSTPEELDRTTDDERLERAHSILAQLERGGIVTPPDSNGLRVVLYTTDGIRLDTAGDPPEEPDDADAEDPSDDEPAGED